MGKSNQSSHSVDLIVAAKSGDYEKVKHLLNAGANPNSVDSSGTSVLSYAIINNHKEICLELLKAGADPDLKNQDGLSPFGIAKRDHHTEIVYMLHAHKTKNNKPTKKTGLFPFEPGMSTKTAHLEYNEFPRMHEFEHQYYRDTIELVTEEIEQTKKKLKNRDLGGADSRTNAILATTISKKIPRLEAQAKKPYFARLDIKTKNGEVQSYYIGSHGMSDDRVYAAQSWLGGLYAQRKLGKVSDSKFGEIEVILIRQIENEDGRIQAIIDKSWAEKKGYVDPILMKRLNENAKAKMNEIWETIQAEQDTVVRQRISVPIIVQGSAGSGKTIIALHRLSYLLFEYKGLEEKKVMIMGPNPMYLKYIQDALPHLDVGSIKQTTFELFCHERIPFEKYGYLLTDYYDIVKKQTPKTQTVFSKIKGSLAYKKAVSEFLEMQKESLLPDIDMMVTTSFGDFSFDKSRLESLFKQYTQHSSIEVSKNRILEAVKSESARFLRQVQWNTSDTKVARNVAKELDEKIQSLIDHWVLPNVFELYGRFVTDYALLKKYMNEIDNEQLKSFAETNKAMLENGFVTHDDLAALLHIQQWLTGKIGLQDATDPTQFTSQKFQYILIDEVQDYSPYQLAVINSVVDNKRITVLGDLGQSIHDYRGISDWQDVKDALDITDDDEYVYLQLSTIYRSTVQIAQLANQVIEPFANGRYQVSEPIGRKGATPSIRPVATHMEQLKEIEKIIKKLKNDDFRNIALITRDWEEADALYKKLSAVLPGLQLVTDATDAYNGGLVIIPVYLTKGIEYDAVILTDASLEKYRDDDTHRKLLYVAITRALHHVFILYKQMLALPILDIVDQEEARRIRQQLKKEESKTTIQAKPVDGKQHILSTIENELNKLFVSHAQEVEALKAQIAQLERELETYRLKASTNLIETTSTTNDLITKLQKQALFEHFIVQSDVSNVQNFLESIDARDEEERLLIPLSVLKDLASSECYSHMTIAMDYIKSEIIKSKYKGGLSEEDTALLLETLADILLNVDISLDHVDVMMEKAFSLIGMLVGSKYEAYCKTFLQKNVSYLKDIIFEVNDANLLLQSLRVYFEFELMDAVFEFLKQLFDEWKFFETQFTKEQLIRLLWYAFYFNQDAAFIELVQYDFLHVSLPEVKLYFAYYHAAGGDVNAKQKIKDLLTKTKLLSSVETALLENKMLSFVAQ
ncbi:UvrD-helicase domain-containing protein [Anoxybacteroides tepidamans]|uniref:UvrD-helicase domain-containing protein n=1 Tax=Anoxybacteroides tepidamans TaxID=265948 RepID=UPI00048866A7|nr:UvrD-helicase domain-containing protein [Anoxybacillus tepidamans]